MEKIIKRFVSMGLLGLLLAMSIYFLIGLELSDVRNMPFLSSLKSFFSYVFAIYIGLICVVVFFENRNPSKTMAWLLVLTLLPGVGFVLYMFLGQNLRKIKKVKNKIVSDEEYGRVAARKQMEMVDQLKSINESGSRVDNRLVRLLLKNSNSPFSTGNKIKILTNGEETFDEIFKQIGKAQKCINIEYFIIKNDDIGVQFKNLLIEKAREGLEIRLIYDAVGSWRLGKAYVEELRAVGIKVFPFLPVFMPFISRELNYRNHRKIITIDGKTGFVGGLNVGDEYLGRDKKMGFWRDTHMMIKGEGVFCLQNIFVKDWCFVSGEVLEGEYHFPSPESDGESIIQVAASGPDTDWMTILQAYFTMIATAEKRIWITTPYLVPEESLMMALKTAALSGVDVRIIIPSKPDHFFVYWASRNNIDDLLKAGVHIYEYTKGFVHSKILIVDGIGSSVGTANLDIRSMEINFEVNAFIYDKVVAQKLESDFEQDMLDSREILLEERLKRGIKEKFLESVGRLASPLQ